VYASAGLRKLKSWARSLSGDTTAALEASPSSAEAEKLFEERPEMKLSPEEEAARTARVETFYKILSVVSAVGFFVGYVVYKGIVQIEVSDGDDEEGGDEGNRGGEDEVEVIEYYKGDSKEERGDGNNEGGILIDEEGNVIYEEDVIEDVLEEEDGGNE
jgi:hypothetical protein